MFLSRWIIGLGWIFWLVILIVVFFVLWLSMGGGDYRFVGLDPLVGDHTQPLEEGWQIHPNMAESIGRRNQQTIAAIPATGSVDREPRTPITNHVPQQRPPVNEPADAVDATPVIPAIILQQQAPAAPPRTTASMLPHRKERAPKLDPRNQAEAICRQTLEEIYGVPFLTHYPAWLRNPETGADLELDCYNPDIGIAVEYNGPQHYKWPNHFPMTKAQFLAQVRRDRYKVDACDANGVYLITVPYNVPYHLIPDYIRYYLPEAVAARLQAQQQSSGGNEGSDRTHRSTANESSDLTEQDDNRYSLQTMQEAHRAQQAQRRYSRRT